MLDKFEIIDLCESFTSLDCSVDIDQQPASASDIVPKEKPTAFKKHTLYKKPDNILDLSSDFDQPNSKIILLSDSEDFYSDEAFWKVSDKTTGEKVSIKKVIPPHKRTKTPSKTYDSKSKEDPNRFSLAKFRKERENLSALLYAKINHKVMKDQLPSGMPLIWSKNLNKTAGRFVYSTNKFNLETNYHIDLSTKVLDSYEKLQSTLAHEMCHAATYIIDRVSTPPHGQVFKHWAKRVQIVFPDIPITIRHRYIISYKHWYLCTGSFCEAIYRRHSKSIDVAKKVCGLCKSRLLYLPKDHPKRSEPTPPPILSSEE